MRLIHTVAASILVLSSLVPDAIAGGDAPTFGRPYQSGAQSHGGQQTYAQAPQPAAPIWTGFYVGAHGGYGRAVAGSGLTMTGGLAGVHLGYMFQSGRMVLGIEGDVSGSGLEKSVSATDGVTTAELKVSVDAVGSLRAIAGVDAGSALFYATGGLAFGVGNGTLAITDPGGHFRASVDYSATGLVFGAGVEYRFSPRMALRAEVLRYNFNEITIERSTEKIDLDATVGRAGITWRFH